MDVHDVFSIIGFIGGLLFWSLFERFVIRKIYKRIEDPNEPIAPWRRRRNRVHRSITSGDSFREYMERQGHTYDEIVWSETYGRYMTMSELRRLFEEEEKKIEIKPKKEKIRHNFTGLPWE